jgi:hypothetical protein
MGLDPVYPELPGKAFLTVREPHPVVPVVVNDLGGMPPLRDSISREEIAAVVSYYAINLQKGPILWDHQADQAVIGANGLTIIGIRSF